MLPDSIAPSSPSVTLSLHPIGGFCAVSSTLPLPDNATPATFSKLHTSTVTRNGLNAHFGQAAHLLAAEPHACMLRVAVDDGESEVAYETAVLGRLRPGQ